MKPKIVNVPSTKNIIQLSPGFKKKELADYKVDLLALCGFGCRYCSSNEGYYLRMNWEKGENFKKLAEEQLGRKFTKKALPSLTFECSVFCQSYLFISLNPACSKSFDNSLKSQPQ